MKTLILAATALALSGSAYAQTYSSAPAAPTQAPQVAVTMDPSVAIVAPAGWTAEQSALWEEQMAYHPGWTAEQVAAFEAMMALPPANWTAEQRALYEAHLAHIPTAWTAEQRAIFEQQVAEMRTPWMSAAQTAQTEPLPATTDTTTTTTTTYAAATPASGPVVQPSNANPEHDARGIAVISDPAYVPPGYNGIGGAMGGPSEGDDETYPPCTRERTDNCTQTYERGVRLESSSTPSTSSSVGGPYEPVSDTSTSHSSHSTTPSSGTYDAGSTTTPTTPDPAGTTEDDTQQPNDYQ